MPQNDDPEFRPINQETHPAYNREPGIARIPGSNFLKEMAKYEQFHSEWTAGTNGPGNPYRYRPFPKMLVRAQRHNGRICCMAVPPDPYADWRDHRQLERAQEAAARFNESCQRIVHDETELARAYEQGWRETVEEAVEFVKSRDRGVSNETAHRNYDDRNMSDAAKAEIAAQVRAHGGEHQPEILEKPADKPRSRVVTDGRCNGKTRKDERCARAATQGLYCRAHVPAASETAAP